MADQSDASLHFRSAPEAIEWQAQHSEKAGAVCTARVIRALLPVLETETATGRRIANWHGLTLEDAVPLRFAGGLHSLLVSGEDKRLEPIYLGLETDQATIDALVVELVETYDHRLLPWLDRPPQTNEVGRSASIVVGLLWLSGRLGSKFGLNEIGASAGINTMLERYRYELGGVETGPQTSPIQIAPEWRGEAPPSSGLSGGPSSGIEIVSIWGCDRDPIDLANPAQAERLKSYVWPEATARMARIDAAIRLATEQPPELVKMDAAEWVPLMLEEPQLEGVTRVLFHSIVWQYIPAAGRDAITAAMEAAGAKATTDRPLAWIMLETNRETFRHELRVKYWPGGEDWRLLAEAHPHGEWVEWFGAD